MRYISIVICLLVLSACAAKTPPRTVRVEGKRTQEAMNLEKKLVAFRDATPTVKGLAWAEFRAGDEERRTESALAIERPSKIRIDAMDALADVWASAGSDGERLWLYIPSKKKLYEGKATSWTMRKLAKFDWEPSELVSIVAGTPPLGAEPDIVQVGEGKEAHFVARGSGLHIWTDGKSGRVTRCVRYAPDGTTKDYEIAFSNFKRIGQIQFPQRIEASFPLREARILIDYRDVEIGSAVKEQAFEPPSARGGKSERIGNE
jgi:hypothetical protein